MDKKLPNSKLAKLPDEDWLNGITTTASTSATTASAAKTNLPALLKVLQEFKKPSENHDDILDSLRLAELPDPDDFPGLNIATVLWDRGTFQFWRVTTINYEEKLADRVIDMVMMAHIEAKELHPLIQSNPTHGFLPKQADIIHGFLPIDPPNTIKLSLTSREFKSRYIPLTKTGEPIIPNHEALFKETSELFKAHLKREAEKRKVNDIPEAKSPVAGSW